MQLTFKIVLDKRYQKQNGTYPLKLRVYESGKYKEVALTISLSENEWCEKAQLATKKCSLYKEYNTKLIETKAKVQKLIIEAENLPWRSEPTDILSRLNSSSKTERTTFFSYGYTLIEKLIKTGKVGNANTYECAINKLKVFIENDNLYFEQLTYKVLEDFSDYLLQNGIRVNTVSVYLRQIRAVYNRAIKEGIVDSKYYPFRNLKIKKEATINRTLTLNELNLLFTTKLDCNNSIHFWRNIFVLSFCLRGINLADLLTLRKENLKNGQITYKRMKTGKIYCIGLNDTINAILQGFPANNSNGLLLPVLKQTNDPVKLKKDIHQAVKTCNKYMNILGKEVGLTTRISSYYARYSWANVAKSLGYSKDVIAEALGHEYGNRVTGIYLDNYSNDLIDEVNESVINAVFKMHKNQPVAAN